MLFHFPFLLNRILSSRVEDQVLSNQVFGSSYTGGLDSAIHEPRVQAVSVHILPILKLNIARCCTALTAPDCGWATTSSSLGIPSTPLHTYLDPRRGQKIAVAHHLPGVGGLDVSALFVCSSITLFLPTKTVELWVCFSNLELFGSVQT